MSNSLWPRRLYIACQAPLSVWDFPSKNTRVGCHFLLQRIFLTQGYNPCLLHWQVDSLSLSHKRSPYNNSKLSMTFKNCESLYCTPVTYIILYINYNSIKKLKEEKNSKFKKKKKQTNTEFYDKKLHLLLQSKFINIFRHITNPFSSLCERIII